LSAAAGTSYDPPPLRAIRFPGNTAVTVKVSRSLWLALALLPVYALLAALVPPFDDEIYYWCWAQQLQLSYYDHPGMVAYMIRLSTAAFGGSLFAIRLPAVLTAGAVTWATASLCGPSRLLLPILLLPVSSFGMVIVTPDTPLLLFGSFYLLWLIRVHQRLDSEAVGRWQWVLGGLLLGAGLLSKYTTVLLAVAGGISFLFAGSWRRWAGGYALHAAVALTATFPILIYNARRDFAPLQFQWAHATADRAGGLPPIAEFLGGQVLLFGAVPLVVLVWALRRRAELCADPRSRVCFCVFALPLGFFLMKACLGRVQANWAWGCYLAGWPLACEWYRRAGSSVGWRAFARLGFALPVGVTVALAVHLVEPLPLIPPTRDRASAQVEKVRLARSVAADLRGCGYSGPVFAETYQWTALLRWHGVDARQCPGRARPSQFTEDPCVSGGDRGSGLEFREVSSVECGGSDCVFTYELVVRGQSRGQFGLLGSLDRGVTAPRGSLGVAAAQRPSESKK
jgi:hypothetical protein